jgi:hypothetical protein
MSSRESPDSLYLIFEKFSSMFKGRNRDKKILTFFEKKCFLSCFS